MATEATCGAHAAREWAAGAEARGIAEELYRELNSIHELRSMSQGGGAAHAEKRIRRGLWTMQGSDTEDTTLTGIKNQNLDWSGLGGVGKNMGDSGGLDAEEAKMRALEEELKASSSILEQQKEVLLADAVDKDPAGRFLPSGGRSGGPKSTRTSSAPSQRSPIPRPPQGDPGERTMQNRGKAAASRPLSATAAAF